MDKTYPQRLHKYELVLRGFYLNALRIQIKPFKDFFLSHGYLGQPSDLISSDALKTGYINSYQFISNAEMYPEWQRQDFIAKKSKKDFSLEDGFLIVSELLKNFFLQAGLNSYNQIRGDLNQTSIDSLTKFINIKRSLGYTDQQIYTALDSEYEDILRARAGLIAATESTTITNLSKKKTASSYFDQNGLTGYKIWYTREDERVRHSHEEVNRRILPVDTQFVLNNPLGGVEFAQEPGDTNLSAANRINCRCFCDYSSSKDDFQ